MARYYTGMSTPAVAAASPLVAAPAPAPAPDGAAAAVPDELVARLAAAVAAGGVTVLTGAGVSTDSGIPDYRSPGKPPPRPMQHLDFVRHPLARARYWARSATGWPRLRAATPGPAHHALARLERAGLISAVITQNVDGLHQRGGGREVLELHGALRDVVCLGCREVTSRDEVQARLLADNPALATRVAAGGSVLAAAGDRPDGDVELEPGADDLAALRVPACLGCGGVLKPDVVFFGDNVPRPRVELARAWVEAARLLLVVGSSLTVFSGYRFVRHADDRAVPVAIVNRGPTRADGATRLRIDAGCGPVLAALAATVGAAP
jgi:NAD-dependent SIR2 family protein deacetylase